jgi:hypothetical protein
MGIKCLIRGIVLLAAGFISIGSAGAGMASAAEAAFPIAEAVRATGPIQVDGSLDEKDWQNAGFTYQLNHYKTKEPVTQKSEFSILYDDNYLYFGVILHEARMDKVVARSTRDDHSVFGDDAVEIFLRPGETAHDLDYYHFVVNVIGSRYGDAKASVSHPQRVGNKMVEWYAKTRKYGDKWTAEIAIPLKVIRPVVENAAYWRLNVCRNEGPSSEVSSWAVSSGNFHEPENFGYLKGIDFDNKFVSLKNEMKPVVSVKGSWGAETQPLEIALSHKDIPVVIIPLPYEVKYTDKDFLVSTATRIIIGEKAVKGNDQAVKELNEEIKDKFGFELPVIKADAVRGDSANSIILGEPGKNSLLDSLLAAKNLKVDAQTPGPEGYILKSEPGCILIAGSDDAGTYYGVQSLKQLLFKNEKDQRFHARGAEVWDKPKFKVRMVHVLVDKESPYAHRKMIAQLFARYKYNHILMEAEQGIAWKSHPEIVTPFAAQPEDIKELVFFAKQHYMQVTPLIQSLGHCGWIFRNGKNMDIVEDKNHPDVYCPLNPRTYEFIFSIMDEALDIFDHPEYLHIGHDEHDISHPFPIHEECKKVGNEKLYYMDTMHIYHHLKLKGVKMMMWSDILSKDSFVPIIDDLPRDIVMCDWIYRDLPEYPSLDYFQSKGFPVLGCSWYRARNIARFSRYGAKSNILGMMYTTWAGYDKNSTIAEREYKQVMGYITQGDYAWNPDHRLPEALQGNHEDINVMPYYSGQVLRDIWYPESRHIKFEKGFSINLAPSANLPLVETAKQPGFGGYGIGNDLSSLVKENQNGILHLMDNIHYRLSSVQDQPAGILLKGPGATDSFPDHSGVLMVNQYARELNFLQTTLYSTKTGWNIGSYKINYADGSHAEIPLVYGGNIGAWNDWNTYYMGDLAWMGYLQADSPVFIRPLKWRNPFPKKKITSIELLNDPKNKVGILLMAVTGIR